MIPSVKSLRTARERDRRTMIDAGRRRKEAREEATNRARVEDHHWKNTVERQLQFLMPRPEEAEIDHDVQQREKALSLDDNRC
jgi:hypothetical protein